jgi:predicted acetyltransferase
MEIRELTAEDYAACKRLRLEAFQDGNRPDSFEMPSGWLDNLQLGVFEGAKMMACAETIDMKLAWGERDAPAGGVAGVACAPARRGRGHVGRLLATSLEAMRERGQFISALNPFSFAFYQGYGWDWVGEMRTVTAPVRELRSAAEGRSVDSCEWPDAVDIVRPVYEEFSRRYRSMIVRNNPCPNWWERKLGHQDGRTTYVHVYSDPETGKPEGYLSFRFEPRSTGKPSKVGDFVWLTGAAYRGLLSILHYYGTQVEKVAWDAPSDHSLPLHLMHWDLGQTVRPVFMGRVVDVVPALEALSPNSELTGSFTIRVSDSKCSWNDGSFTVWIESAHVAVKPATGDPAVELDIRALSQAYWGKPCLAELRGAERIKVHDERGYKLLEKLLPPAVSFVGDFF